MFIQHTGSREMIFAKTLIYWYTAVAIKTDIPLLIAVNNIIERCLLISQLVAAVAASRLTTPENNNNNNNAARRGRRNVALDMLHGAAEREKDEAK